MKRIITRTMVVLIVLFIQSCTKTTDEELLPDSTKQKRTLLRETSILVGMVLQNDQTRDEVVSVIHEVDPEGDAVSFSYLLGLGGTLKKNEIGLFEKESSRASSSFKMALADHFLHNQEKFPSLAKAIQEKAGFEEGNISSRSSFDIANELNQMLESENLQIFYPYDPEYEEDDRTVSEYILSYDPLVFTQTNEGFLFSKDRTGYELIETIDNTYVDENPVFGIVPIDPCDIQGNPCPYITIEPTIVGIDGDLNVDGTTPWNANSSTLPPLSNTPYLLTYSVDHKDIPEEDIISSYIPRIKINGTSWMGFLGRYQKLSFFRGFADKNLVTQNPDGSISVRGEGYPVKIGFRTRRRNIRRKRWLNFDVQFDPDWDMSENSQSMVVFSLHTFSGSASANVSVKAGVKLEDGEIKPHFEPGGTGTVSISTGSAKFRAAAELSRRQIFSSIVGPDPGGKTVIDNGIEYNVKSVGIVDYYYKHWHTDLTP